jgi:3-isopropylmalate/(R)-2-methylmalate dehydratase large subunit
MNKAMTMFEKIWDEHVVRRERDRPAIVYVDLHLIHEVTSPQAFDELRGRAIGVRRPDRTLGTMDHSIPTRRGGLPQLDDEGRHQLSTLVENCERTGVELHQPGAPGHGIVHVIGPELGRTQPGMVIVCGDSHTSTHGAFGALSFGIGTSEVGHVLASQCLLQQEPRTMEVRIEGALQPGVTAKDLVLAVIAQIGTDGGTGHVIEYRGGTVEALDMEGRMTLCNMSIEAGARAGMVAPDETCFDYLRGRPTLPPPDSPEWDQLTDRWRALATGEGASFDRSVTLDATQVEPMVTYGTTPAMAVGVTEAIPSKDQAPTHGAPPVIEAALQYMGFESGRPLEGQAIEVAFIGSCTNARLGDLRAAARVMRGKRVAAGVRALVVPGSQAVKRAAESEGLDRVFLEAGAEWREPGCSMCIAMNGDRVEPGQVVISTSNRNFEGRQGKGGRTILASPLTAAASAIAGRVADPRGHI